MPNLTVFGHRLAEITPTEVHGAVYFGPLGKVIISLSFKKYSHILGPQSFTIQYLVPSLEVTSLQFYHYTWYQ